MTSDASTTPPVHSSAKKSKLAKRPAGKKLAATKKPAGRKSPADINKSAEIRKVAAAMKAEGKKPRPVLIIETLKKRGIKVSSPQVSMVLKRMGFRPLRKRNTAATGAGNPAKPGLVSVEDLVSAKRVAISFGNADKAIAALQALKRFEG